MVGVQAWLDQLQANWAEQLASYKQQVTKKAETTP
jgi:hypothetical protein